MENAIRVYMLLQVWSNYSVFCSFKISTSKRIFHVPKKHCINKISQQCRRPPLKCLAGPEELLWLQRKRWMSLQIQCTRGSYRQHVESWNQVRLISSYFFWFRYWSLHDAWIKHSRKLLENCVFLYSPGRLLDFLWGVRWKYTGWRTVYDL